MTPPRCDQSPRAVTEGALDGFLLADFLSMDTRLGYSAELLDGEIILRPPPDGNHESVLSEIVKQICRRSSTELDLSFRMGLATAAGRFIPALAVWAEGALADKPPWAPTENAVLVMEVSSANPERDHVTKRKGYAAAGIPLYLLVDRQGQTVVLHSDPDADTGDYLTVHNAPYGKEVPLPAPFDFALETSDF